MATPRKTDCSDMTNAIVDVVEALAQDRPVVTDLDTLMVAMNDVLPDVDRRMVIDAIEDARVARPRAIQAALVRIRQDSKSEDVATKALDVATRELSTGVREDATPRQRRVASEALQSLRELRRSVVRQTNLKDQIADLERQLETFDFTPQKKRRRTINPEIAKLEVQRDQMRRRVNEAMRTSEKRTLAQKAMGLPRSVPRFIGTWITTGEWSAVFNQGGFVVIPDIIFFPFTGFARKTRAALKAGFTSQLSAEGEVRVQKAMETDPDHMAALESGIDFTSGAELNTREETQRSQLVERIPILSGFVRFHRTFLNALRFEHFKYLYHFGSSGELNTQAENIAIADMVNNMTGRGSLGSAERAGQVMADLMFAPKYYASRLNLLVGAPYWRAPKGKVKRAIVMQYVKFALATAAVQSLLQLAGSEEEELDPRSTDFLQGRFGRVRIDFNAGFRQWITFATRILTGDTKTLSGEVKSFRETFRLTEPTGDDQAFFSRTGFDIVADFARSKFSPGLGIASNIIDGQDFIGRQVGPADLVRMYALPITWRDIWDVLNSRELGLEKEVALSTFAMFGGFINPFNDPDEVEARRR